MQTKRVSDFSMWTIGAQVGEIGEFVNNNNIMFCSDNSSTPVDL